MKANKVVISAVLALAIGLLPLAAGERRGAEVVVSMRDGTQVSGELIAVKKDSLLLLAGGPIADTDLTVALNEIKEIKIVKKSRLWNGLGYGLLIGGGGGALVGFASGDDPPGWVSFTAPQKAMLCGVVFGGLGMILGAIGGGLSGIDESILIGDKSKSALSPILDKLAKVARIRGIR